MSANAPETPSSSAAANFTVALVGNPNTGKSTLFNALTGMRQRIGNYPGVTVEKKSGRFSSDGVDWSIIDLPGTYSLAPRSPDERVTLDVLLGQVSGMEPIDLVVCVVDASNLRRNLYLASQILELGLPTVIALTMVDIAQGRGEEISALGLEEQLGVPVIPVHAAQRIGLGPLKVAMADQRGKSPAIVHQPLPDRVYDLAREMGGDGAQDAIGEGRAVEDSLERLQMTPQQWVFLRYMLDPADTKDSEQKFAQRPDSQQLMAARYQLESKGLQWCGLESEYRYKWIDQQLATLVPHTPEGHHSATAEKVTWSDRLDDLLTHRLWGTIAFVVMMFLLFTAVFKVAEPFSALLDMGLGFLADLVTANMAPGMFRSLILSGVLDGVGGVLVFLPQIFVLFFFIGILEDSGYLARSAFLMDRWMSPLGLSGKSFIPLLSSFACAVPGIMGTRVIDRPRDRLLTIMIAPLMSCSARLPVYIVFTSAFIPEQNLLGIFSLRALIFIAMYLVGVIVAALIAFIWKRFFWREKSGDFFLELPSYKRPSLRVVAYRMWERGSEFIKRAGTVILAMTILIWAANYFPRNEELVQTQTSQISQLEAELEQSPTEERSEALTAQIAELENQVNSIQQENSYLGQAGKLIEPAVRPLGWDWKIGCAVLASFPAREVVVATLGVLYGVGDDPDLEEDTEGGESNDLYRAMQAARWEDTGEPVFNIPVALSVMVFFALCSQCVSTLATIYTETRSWVWPVVSFVYMTVLAYLGAMLVYQVGALWL